MSFALLALGAAGLVAAQASETPKTTAECVDTLVFFARGNDAPYHDSRTTPFIDATCAKVRAEGRTCDYMDIKFSVLLGGPYCDQVAEGTSSGISEITAYQKQCPCSHIVVGGYSEGANVVGNVLAGASGCADDSTGIDPASAAGKAIAAAVVWGNPRHVANQVYNVGSGSGMQGTARDADSLVRLGAYSSKFRDYCQSGDPICAGGNNVTEHLDYFDIFTQDAANWVLGKVDAAAPLCPASSSIVSSTTATAAAVSSTAVSSSAVVSSSSAAVSSSSAVASSSSVANSSSVVIVSSTAAAVSPSSAYAEKTSSVAITTPSPIATSATVISSVSGAPSVDTSCVSAPYGNSTIATVATLSPSSVSQESTIAFPTTIKTVASASSPAANGGYSVGGPTTIVTVPVTSTKIQQSTVTRVAVPSKESEGYPAESPVASAPKPAGPKGSAAPQPSAPQGYATPSAPAGPAGPKGSPSPYQPAGPKGSAGPQPPAPQGYATPSTPAVPQQPAGPKGSSAPQPPAPQGYATPSTPAVPQQPAGPKGSSAPQPPAPQGYTTPEGPAGPEGASTPDVPAAEGYSTPQAPQVSAPAALSGSYQGSGESQCAVVTKTVYI